jgi:N,N'-diacetyllegionaminate synthase
VLFLSSPFSLEAVDLLEKVGVLAYNVPSGEVTNLPLMDRLAATGKPVLLSSGMSDWAELDAAVSALRKGGPVTIMHPCPPERVGLNVIVEMKQRYGLPVGYSDHTTGSAAPLAAAALGATVIEKHFTFSKLMYGSDAANAMEPADFTRLASGLREVWSVLESPVNKDDLAPYREMKRIFEKSVVTARALPAGYTVARDDIAFKKPGDGISAARWPQVVGRRLRKAVGVDYKLDFEDFE